MFKITLLFCFLSIGLWGQKDTAVIFGADTLNGVLSGNELLIETDLFTEFGQIKEIKIKFLKGRILTISYNDTRFTEVDYENGIVKKITLGPNSYKYEVWHSILCFKTEELNKEIIQY